VRAGGRLSLSALWFVACTGKDEVTVPDDEPTETDADTDADTDSDTDTDTDSDTDSDTDTDPTETGTTPLPRLFDANHVLVIPDGRGLVLLASDGTRAFDQSWTTLVGPCDRCGGEGASADGDGLLLSFTTRGPTGGGAVARVSPTGLDWRVDGFGFPHDAIRDPFDDTVLIPEVTGDRVSWIPGDGSTAVPVRRLDNAVRDWDGELPNGGDRFDHDGRSFLLLSHRGSAFSGNAQGFLTLWDITTAAAPTQVWRYPASGSLRTPHGPVFREYDGQLWLLYAHTDARTDTGTVGVAVTTDPTVLPQYVADLVPDGAGAPFDFLRGVELTDDGQLWLTDSGPGGGTSVFAEGRVLSAPFPSGLVPATESGASSDRHDVAFTPTLFADGFVNPFEGWLWVPTF
jgi:hypothetical protein